MADLYATIKSVSGRATPPRKTETAVRGVIETHKHEIRQSFPGATQRPTFISHGRIRSMAVKGGMKESFNGMMNSVTINADIKFAWYLSISKQ